MHLIKKLTATVLVSTVIATASCGDGATTTGPARTAPVAPLFDGIGTAGSGNRSSTDSTTAPTSTGNEDDAAGGSTAADADSTTATGGIGTAGSGN